MAQGQPSLPHMLCRGHCNAQRQQSSICMRCLYITILYAASLYKTQGDFAQPCHMTLDLFPAAAKGFRGCLCFI